MRIRTKFKINQFVFKYCPADYPQIKCGYITGFKYYNNKLTYYVKWGDLHRYPNLLETEENENDIFPNIKKLKKFYNNPTYYKFGMGFDI